MKIEVKKTERKTFEKVELREPLIRDLVEAEKVAGSTSGMQFSCALLARISTWDGVSLPMEEIMGMPVEVFLDLAGELPGVMGSLIQPSESPKPSSI